MSETQSSRIPDFYKHNVAERLAIVAERAALTPQEREVLQCGGLSLRIADHMIENVIGVYGLPLGIATNFLINGRDVLIPMVVEEPSVVAGASFAAKLARVGGGFKAVSTAPEMIGQIQVLDVPNLHKARFDLLVHAEELLALANRCDPVLVNLGGGARTLEVRLVEQSPVGGMLVVHVIYDTRDAMGANAVNTMCEALAPRVEEITGGRVVLRILSNLAERRLVRVQCTVPAEALTFTSDGHFYPGQQVVRRIVEASALAVVDPYRAATHNKGIMNGVDAVVIATGNDWRAVEAGAHAYAARTGRYTALSHWEETPDGDLVGTLEMPMAVGIVGGTARSHPTAQVALKILGANNAQELAEIIAAVGLAQNLAALRALATEGIQRGHMRLHARQQLLAEEGR
ncbi:MAG: hydroxymethylglutaryl-CoA reductase, degradative [Ardenticatenia bacterium]|nr:MAG: hydroxymethylglutaryl-CoA reductase, degradative [Ardenticatenia bacterium]